MEVMVVVVVVEIGVCMESGGAAVLCKSGVAASHTCLGVGLGTGRDKREKGGQDRR